MNIFFAGVHDGSNADALLKYCQKNIPEVECYTFGHEDWDIVFTTNGRLVEHISGRLKVNLQHGNLFLGDTQPEPQYHIDLALAASESERSMMVRNGYRPEDVLVTGQPRTDLLYQATRDSSVRIQYLQSKGLEVSKPTILYAPTYSRKAFGGGDKYFFALSGSVDEDYEAAESLLANCDGRFNLIIRLHKYIKRDYDGQWLPKYLKELFANIEVHDNEIEPNSIPVLAASDILITDFSSITADFLALDRDIFFIEPHKMWKYTDQWHASKHERRGMGITIVRWEEFDEIESQLGFYPPRRRAMRDQYQPLFDGKCCERVFNTVMERVNGNQQ